jgi:hypothetical protein
MNDPLAKYNFHDDHGHPLENCQEYTYLRAANAKLTEELARVKECSAWAVEVALAAKSRG